MKHWFIVLRILFISFPFEPESVNWRLEFQWNSKLEYQLMIKTMAWLTFNWLLFNWIFFSIDFNTRIPYTSHSFEFISVIIFVFVQAFILCETQIVDPILQKSHATNIFLNAPHVQNEPNVMSVICHLTISKDIDPMIFNVARRSFNQWNFRAYALFFGKNF